MKDLRSKVSSWNEKVEKGNDKYVKIAPCKNEMFYMYFGKPYQIKSIKALVDTGERVKLHYCYENGACNNSDFSFSAIIKNKNSMIVDDEKLGLLSFGLGESDENQSVKNMIVHIRTNFFHSIIMADRYSNTMVMMEELTSTDVSADDAVSVCISKLISQITANPGGNDGI